MGRTCAPGRYVVENKSTSARRGRASYRGNRADRREFEETVHEQAAARMRFLLACSALLILAFTIFDLAVDPIPPAVLEMRLWNNGGILGMLVIIELSLTNRWLRQRVFGLMFLLCASATIEVAFLFGRVSPDAARLAFHYLCILGLGVIAIQWSWPWQLGLGVVVLVCFHAAVPAESPNFGFFAVAIGGTTCVMAAVAGVLTRWRYVQFCTEAQLRQANHTKSEFLSTMSHELRTPLNIIVGYSDLLQEGAMGLLSEEQVTVVNHVRRAGRHLLSLVESTLNVSRLESGRVAVDLKRFSLHEFVAELRADVARLVNAQSRVPVVWEVGADRVWVEIDQMKLREIVLNLLGNAIKFTDSGEIRVRIAVDPAGGLEVKVKDTGIGIPAERLPTIFESFEQLHPARSDTQQGVGLGLYIVERLVDLLNGRIEVESAVGQGTEFRIQLPVRIVSLAASPLTAAVPASSRAAAA